MDTLTCTYSFTTFQATNQVLHTTPQHIVPRHTTFLAYDHICIPPTFIRIHPTDSSDSTSKTFRAFLVSAHLLFTAYSLLHIQICFIYYDSICSLDSITCFLVCAEQPSGWLARMPACWPLHIRSVKSLPQKRSLFWQAVALAILTEADHRMFRSVHALRPRQCDEMRISLIMWFDVDRSRIFSGGTVRACTWGTLGRFKILLPRMLLFARMSAMSALCEGVQARWLFVIQWVRCKQTRIWRDWIDWMV